MFRAIDISRNARFIKPLNSQCDDQRFACACTDGTLLVATLGGEVLWEASIHCFPHDFWVGTLDSHQTEALLVAGSDGVLHAYSTEGESLWSYQANGPLFQVFVAAMGKSNKAMVFTGGADHHLYVFDLCGTLLEKRLLPETTVPPPHGLPGFLTGRGAVKFLRAGDIDGSGEKTLVVSENMRIMHHDLLFFKGENLVLTNRIQHFEKDLPGVEFRNLEISDINGDGIEELVVGHGSWKGGGFWVFNMETQTRIWKSLHEPHAMHRCDTNYRDTRVLSLKVDGEQRVIAHCGHQMSVLNSKLEIIQQAYAPSAFMGIAAFSHGASKGVLLASGFGGDENVYQLIFDGSWVNEFEAFSRVGKMAEVSRQIGVIRDQIASASANPLPIACREPHIIQVGSCYIYKHRVGELHHYIKHNQWVRRQFPYSNMKLTTMVAISEKQKNGPRGVGLLGDRFDAGEVVQILKNFEEGETPFMLYLAQGTEISLTVATLERIAEVCPTTFLGCYGAETGLHEPITNASKKFYQDFLDERILPSLDFLAKHRKKFIMNEKFCCWISTALLEGTYDRLFQDKYRDVVIPCVEDSATSSPELNLAGRVGLWMAGKVNRWGTRTTNDDYGNEFIWQGGNPVMSGHQSLRKVTAHAALGASVFLFNCGQDNGSGEPCYKPTQGDVFFWTRVGWESAVPFIHLLGRGLLIPPQREEMSGVARIGLAIKPSDRFAFTANNVCMNEYFDGSPWEDEHVFSRLAGVWAMSPSLPSHFSSCVFDQKRQGTNFVPSTPYGFVPIIPQVSLSGSTLEIEATNGETKMALDMRYASDGERGSLNGQVLSTTEWRTNLLSDLAEARKLLPFVADGDVFMNAFVIEGGYTLCIVDSECELLHDKDVVLNVQDKQITNLVDMLSEEILPVEQGIIRLTIPAGTFRLFRALKA